MKKFVSLDEKGVMMKKVSFHLPQSDIMSAVTIFF